MNLCTAMMSFSDVADGPLHRYRIVQISDSDGPSACPILAFAECLLLAKSRRQRHPSITTGLHPKADVELPMSGFSLFTSVVGCKAAVSWGAR
jgi:hypothetical protein